MKNKAYKILVAKSDLDLSQQDMNQKKVLIPL